MPEAPKSSAAKRSPWTILLLILLMAMPGCGGCQTKTAAQKKKEEEEAKKRLSLEKKVDPFTLGQITPLPAEVKLLKPLVTDPEELDALEEEKRKEEEARLLGNKLVLRYVKPGHWTGLVLPIRSNQIDIGGDLIASTIDPKTQELAEVDNTLFRFTLTRPITLAKGQAKYLESIAYVPKSLQSGASNVRFRNEVISGGRRVAFLDEPTTALNPFQYFFLVVAANPDQYTYLRVANFNSPSSDVDEERGKFYHIIAPKFENELPLPIHAATWTNLAYVLWDEVDAKRVDAEQQKAMIDWLHWGGQLVINGPRTLEMLRGSFLDEFLPAGANKSLTIDGEALEVLNQNWYIEPKTDLAKKDERRKIQLKPNETIAGVELSLRAGGSFVPKCGNLLAERRVGRGRVVVSAFPLYQRALINWSCYDNFMNNALLRRLPRRYQFGDSSTSQMSYLTPGVNAEDPRVSTTLRYFSRDAGDNSTMVTDIQPTSDSVINQLRFGTNGYDEEEKRRQAAIDRASAADVDTNDWHFAGYVSSGRSGVAGWNDSGAVPNAARSALTEAAGIEIPERNFVLRMMLVYLAALVPLNWIVFRLLGRLEWAWIAAPIMAVIAAVAVIRLAQLDIGFARSQTEINIVETHGGYDRAHVTRYAALYTSLSSSYRIEFVDPSGIVLPFSTFAGTNDKFMPRLTDTYKTVSLDREASVRLSGFGVDSNSTGLLHAEHMLPLGGSFKVTGDEKAGWTLQNDTKVRASVAIALYRDQDGALHFAPLDEVAPEAKIALQWQKVNSTSAEGKAISVDEALAAEINKLEDKASPGGESASQLKLRKLLDLACGKIRVAPGEIRLVAILPDRPDGMIVSPVATQVNAATLLLVHLKHGAFSAPESDENLKLDVKAIDVPDPLNLDENPDQIGDPAVPGATPAGGASANTPATGNDAAKVP